MHWGMNLYLAKQSYKFVSSHCPNECVLVEECVNVEEDCGDGEKECGLVGCELAVKKVVIP